MNRPPILSSISDSSMNEGDTLNLPISSTDPDSDNISLSANNLPVFAAFTDNGDGTGSIRFVTDFTAGGVYPDIQVIATDNGTPSLTDTVLFTLTVGNVNRPPMLSSVSAQSMNEGDTLSLPISSTDPDSDNISLSTNNLPAFATFTDNGDGTGSIRFIPTFNDSGTYQNIGLIAADDGNPVLSDTIYFTLIVRDSIVVEIENLDKQIPTSFHISQNYPNPFNPTTTIKYQIPKTVDVRIEVFNILGQKVRTLVNARLAPGYYEITWNGTDDTGRVISSGIYIYLIKAEDFVRSKKMILLK